MAAEPEMDPLVRGMTLALATLATAAAELALAEPGQSPAISLAGAAGMSSLAWGFDRWSSRRVSRGRGISRPLEVATVVGLFLLPIAVEVGRLALSGRVQTMELVALASLRNLGLGLAALSRGPTFARTAALVSLFLVLSASSMVEGGTFIVTIAACYAVAGSLWLVTSYWRTLFRPGVVGDSRRFPALTLVGAMGVVGAFLAVAAIGPMRAATVLAGLVPSSGGTLWNDPDARGGVNDGDNEVRGSEKPESVGFAESDVYLDTDRPSLYDAFNDMYGEPPKPKKNDKMIALSNPNIQEQKEVPAENLRAGRQFSAVRKPPDSPSRRPGDREARALVYVKGRTPLHLGLAAYDRFDGRAWDEEDFCTTHCPLEPEGDDSWLSLATPPPPIFSGTVEHQIKIGTLDSSPLPVPPYLARLRVGRVDRADFFGWSHESMVRMTERTVPAGTVLETEARTTDPRRLLRVEFGGRPYAADRLVSFPTSYRVDPAVEALARSWTSGIPRSWRQIDAIVEGLRRHATHDRGTTTPLDCPDVVGHFLLESRRGPDYLFATSAAVMLRTLGYPCRVISGFYASPARYDPRTRHTPVTTEDVHFWAEVRLPSGTWVAIEPTPGYHLMGPSPGWTESFLDALAAVGRWTRARAIALAGVGAMLLGLVLFRREALNVLATLSWLAGSHGPPRRRVAATLRLLERRSRWAGRPRPPWQTPRRWYATVASTAPPELRGDLVGLLGLAEWSLYAPDEADLPPHWLDLDPTTTCRNAVRGWTLSRFRTSARMGLGKEDTSWN